MKRTTLFVEESVDHDLHALARRKGVPVSALVRESLERYISEQKRGHTFALRFLGQGHSGRTDIAERHEEFLWRDLGPHASKRRQRGRG
jgi:predicted DNA-binding protein